MRPCEGSSCFNTADVFVGEIVRDDGAPAIGAELDRNACGLIDLGKRRWPWALGCRPLRCCTHVLSPHASQAVRCAWPRATTGDCFIPAWSSFSHPKTAPPCRR